ncbi:MAG: hypothetical protein ACOCWQ_02995 [Nanoarchaeota archaeon]
MKQSALSHLLRQNLHHTGHKGSILDVVIVLISLLLMALGLHTLLPHYGITHFSLPLQPDQLLLWASWGLFVAGTYIALSKLMGRHHSQL